MAEGAGYAAWRRDDVERDLSGRVVDLPGDQGQRRPIR